jgi:hypothetical protein
MRSSICYLMSRCVKILPAASELESTTMCKLSDIWEGLEQKEMHGVRKCFVATATAYKTESERQRNGQTDRQRHARADRHRHARTGRDMHGRATSLTKQGGRR